MRTRRSSLIYLHSGELYERRVRLMLTQSDLASLVGCSLRTVITWEQRDAIGQRWWRAFLRIERNRPEHARISDVRRKRAKPLKSLGYPIITVS